MNKIKEITQKNACIWPVLGCVLLFAAIVAVTGSFNLGVIYSCAKLCVFALLLGLGQMIVVASGDGAIDFAVSGSRVCWRYIPRAVARFLS